MITSALQQVLAILDVGHGNSSVLIDKKGVVVIDTGPGTVLSEFLEQYCVRRIDVILISHADQDHLGALAQLIASREFEIGRIVLNSDASKMSIGWDDLLYALNKSHCKGELTLVVGLLQDTDPGFDRGKVHIEVLGPSRYLAAKGPGSSDRKGRKIMTNSISAVIRLSVNEQPLAIIAGDLDDIGLDDMIESGSKTEAPVLVFPHHGGKPGTPFIKNYVAKLCEAVQPEIVIFSFARGIHEMPNPEVVAVIRKSFPNVRILCTQLSEYCADALPADDMIHLTPAFARGKEYHCCCGGTIIVQLTYPLEVYPSREAHAAFVKNNAPTALCR